MSPLPHTTSPVTIASLGGLGDGVTEWEGKPLYVAKSCAGDVADVAITKRTKDAGWGRIATLHTAGPDRMAAPCPHEASCGGCSLQHISEAAYRAFKQRMLDDAISWAGYAFDGAAIEWLPAHSRRRVQFQIVPEPAPLALALHEPASHTLAPIAQCLILHPDLQALLPALTDALKTLPQRPSALQLTLADNGIDLWLDTDSPLPHAALEGLTRSLKLARVGTRAGQFTRIAPVILCGEVAVKLPPQAFIQASKQAQDALTRIATQAMQGCMQVADLFCGLGSYGFALPATSACTGFDNSPQLIAAANAAAQPKRRFVRRDLFKRPLSAAELKAYDGLMLNPPRAGAAAQCEQIAASGVSRMAMISCNPATFSRDAAALRKAGFALDFIGGVDQFVFSPHLEIAAVFSR